jgi:hypothetical protein
VPEQTQFEVELGSDQSPCSHPNCPKRSVLDNFVRIDLEPGGGKSICLVPDCPRQNKMSS